MTEITQIYDPFETASNPPVLISDLWGQIDIKAWYCVLEKGVGKVAFDPAQHELGQRRTAIDIVIFPLPELNITNTNICERHLIAESDAWRNITLKSIKELGFENVREINGKWVHIVPEETGRKYEKDGQQKSETMFKILAVYNTEEECHKAYLAAGGSDNRKAAPDNGNNGSEKEVAKQFLPVIVRSVVKGAGNLEAAKTAVAKAISQYPQVAKYFTVDSPEVATIIAEELAPF